VRHDAARDRGVKEAMAHMGRTVALSVGVTLIVILSAGLAGGQVGVESAGGFLWWGTHEPIYIYGDCAFTIENGVTSGSGTAADPYVIEGWRIDAPRADYGIYVDHTSRHFVIRDCVIERARSAGVYLNSVKNGVIEGVQIGLSDTAVCLLNSYWNRISSSVIADCSYGVVMEAGSGGNLISGNSFIRNGLSAQDLLKRNCWCEDGRGNYWSEFCGCDADGDGVYDAPNFRVGDACPLVLPPVEWTGVTTAGLSYSGNWIAPDGSLVVTSQTPIALRAADPGAGMGEIRYSIDCGEWTIYDGPIYLSGPDGPRTIRYFGTDVLGNVEDVKTVSFVLDNHPPATVLEIGRPVYVDERGTTWITSKTPICLRRTQESTYGRTLTYFRVDGRNWQIYSGPFVVYGPDGLHQISFYSRNASGVAEDLETVIVCKDDAPPITRGGSTSPTTEVIVGTPTTEPEVPASELEESPATVMVEPEPAESPTPEPVETVEVQTPSEATVTEELDVQSPSGTVSDVQTSGEAIGAPADLAPEVQTPSSDGTS
jgi:hypothetical protein